MSVQQERTSPLFSCIYAEDRIPASHPLLQVRRLADQALDRLNQSGGSIDRNVHTVVPDVARAAPLTVACDAVPDLANAGQLLDVGEAKEWG
jgi:hypothetical protein